MPRDEKRGTGMMQRRVRVFEEGEEAGAVEAWREAIEAGCFKGWDGTREDNARHARAVLRGAYAEMDPAKFHGGAPEQAEENRADMAAHPERFVGLYFGEDHAYAILKEWLDAHDAFVRAFERVEAGGAGRDELISVAMFAEKMGRLQERLYWRAGVDPDSGKRREALALSGRKIHEARKNSAGAINSGHAPMREKRRARMAELVPSLGIEKAARQCEGRRSRRVAGDQAAVE